MLNRIPQSLRRLATRLSPRRGSMLILVIVILVLLALIGTAMISTSRIDRLSTAQHAANTQIDLFVQSVENISTAIIVGDLYAGTLFRPPANAIYHDWDSIGHSTGTAQPDDTFIASRVPIPDVTPGLYTFSKFTAPLIGSLFESPYKPTAASAQYSLDLTGATMTQVPVINNGVTTNYPGFLIGGTLYLGGDADGDGIADSGMFKLPVGELNGVTYYAAVRILDGGSAINATTAWYGMFGFDTAATPAKIANQGFFSSNVGLMELLTDYNAAGTYGTLSPEMTTLNKYRFNSSAGTVVATNSAGTAVPYDDAGVAISDFVFSSQGDAFSTQVGNRVGNPGHRTTSLLMQSLPISESLAMASRFCLKSGTSSPSILESSTTGIPSSVYTNVNVRSVPYLPGDIANWYNTNFNYLTPGMPLRALVTSRNAVSNIAPAHDISALTLYATSNENESLPLYNLANTTVSKISVNTASFNQLWQGFWNTMTATPLTAPYTDSADGNPFVDGRMFRSLLRDPRPTTPPRAASVSVPMTSQETLMIRSAMAAVNTLALRGNALNDYTVPSRRIFVRDSTNLGNVNSLKYDVMLYGGQPQPFITEVFADTSTAYGPKGYVAVELYNPYDVDISLANWNLGVIYRPDPATVPTPPFLGYPQLQITPLTAFLGFGAPGDPTLVIPAKGYIVLENLGTGPKAATVRPPEITTAPAKVISVPSLSEVFSDPADTTKPGGELVLLRPRRMVLTGTKLECDALSKSSTGLNGFDETATTTAPTSDNLAALVPVDQYDFTGLVLTAAPPFQATHYVRQSDPVINRFKQVYPGKYSAQLSSARQEGTEPYWDPSVPGHVLLYPLSLGLGDASPSYVNNFPPIEWANIDFGGFNKSASAGANTFPFGGFARNGDMLQIPYVGAYRIREMNPDGNLKYAQEVFLELNSLSMDTTRAEDGDSTDDANEMIGRFCPLNAAAPNAYPGTTALNQDYYAWTSSLFNYLSVSVPSDDYLPNVDPGLSDYAAYGFTYKDNAGAVVAPGALALLPTTSRYPQGNGATIPMAVKNSSSYVAADSRVPTVSEALVPREGLININTAPWYVMQALPFVAATTLNYPDLFTLNTATGAVTVGPDGISDNQEIAKIICAWRDGNGLGFTVPGGPFTSIYDLNKVTAINSTVAAPLTFQNRFGTITIGTTQLDDYDGDLSPYNPTSTARGLPTVDGVLDGFSPRFVQLNRVSNLITTRSDMYTVYVLVQGWRNVGTATPELVVQRRAAIMVDRTPATPLAKTVNIINVPTQ